MRVVALEEHFLTAELADRAGSDSLSASLGREIDTRLLDLGAGRLAAMDEAGIDVQVLSHSSPAAQQLEPAEAMRHARAANDHLARAVAEHPHRFAGFATLPTSDPDAAAEEMHRAVRDLHFVGAMVNSTLGTNGTFLDDARYEPLLAAAEDLDVPLYLHPSEPPADLHARLYGGFNRETEMFLATAAWGWHAEAGLHALRMVVGGVFERHPGLRMVIGHGGEMLPFMMARIDAILPPERTGLAMRPSEYFLRNVWVTTSGLFSLPPVLCAVQVFGIDRVLFSVDYPYSPNGAGRRLLDMLPMSPADRARIAGGNADRLLGLGAPDAS